jgi:hypothetical protein
MKPPGPAVSQLFSVSECLRAPFAAATTTTRREGGPVVWKYAFRWGEHPYVHRP